MEGTQSLTRGRRRVMAAAITVGLVFGLGSAVAVKPASIPAPRITRCPAVGQSPGCEILLVVNSDGTVNVKAGPPVGRFDGDDTLVGIVNDSHQAVHAVTVTEPGSDLSGFDGGGICGRDHGSWAGSADCPFGPTGYEGPGTSFVTDPSLPDSAQINFTNGLAPDKSAYFSLKGALTSARFTAVRGALDFTVSGSLPVLPSSSQDTHATYPSSVCSTSKFNQYEADATVVEEYFAAENAPSAATLLEHFLGGSGTPMNFPSGSALSQQLLSNSQFQALNSSAQRALVNAVNQGENTIKLAQPPLQKIPLNLPNDLEYSFGGTQGLQVKGTGRLVNGHYVGTLTYTIQDSYGFSTNDHFVGNVGDDMRYLQTNCGAPQTPGGALWFPDSVTINVPFSLAAGVQ
jgi:hypothetical protein